MIISIDLDQFLLFFFYVKGRKINLLNILEDKRIIIEGVNHEGSKFRPSDWAERLSGKLCSFINHRMRYSPMLKPGIKNGNRCVYISPDLAATEPELFWEIIDFAKKNRLQICNSSDLDLNLDS